MKRTLVRFAAATVFFGFIAAESARDRGREINPDACVAPALAQFRDCQFAPRLFGLLERGRT